MNLFLDSFWRAVVYCMRPRVIFLSVLPLVFIVLLTMVTGYFFWDAAIDQVRVWVDSFPYLDQVWRWLESVGAGKLKAVLVPLLVVFAVTPLIVVVSMLAVALMMTPALVDLVAANRFAGLEARNGGGFASSLAWSFFSTLLAALALLISVPLWLLPPLVLLIPPLIWGWLTYRVMAFDALAKHASKEERRVLFKRHGTSLLLMGVICGYLGASPSLVWAMGAGFAPAFVFLVPVAIWIYTFVFAFASLWFTHYCLGALHLLRAQASAAANNPAQPAAAVAPDAARLALEGASMDTSPLPNREAS
jgi:hypothetical protein